MHYVLAFHSLLIYAALFFILYSLGEFEGKFYAFFCSIIALLIANNFVIFMAINDMTIAKVASILTSGEYDVDFYVTTFMLQPLLLFSETARNEASFLLENKIFQFGIGTNIGLAFVTIFGPIFNDN